MAHTNIRKFSLKSTLRWFIYLLMAAVLLSVILNLPVFDEKPDPELQTAVAPVTLPPSTENAWVALSGFNATGRLDMVSAGQSLIALHDRKVDEGISHSFDEEDYRQILGLGDPNFSTIDDWLQNFDSCTPRAAPDCLTEVTAQLSSLDYPERLNLLINRWQTLLTMPYFTERQLDSAEDSLPAYSLLMRTTDIALAKLATENSGVFLSMLEQDSIFWRRVLDGETSLIAKMVAIASLWRDAQYLSSHMRNTALTSAEIEIAKHISASLTAQEMDISEVWKYEMRIDLNSVKPKPQPFLQRLFMQEQATDNAVFRYTFKPLMALSQLTPPELMAYVKQQETLGELPMQCCSSAANTALLSPAFLYNPAGKLKLAGDYDLGSYNLEDYMERVFDLEGYLRLISLQIQTIETASNTPEQFLNQTRFTNPYTGQAVNWNDTQRTLSFECHGLGNYCAISL